MEMETLRMEQCFRSWHQIICGGEYQTQIYKYTSWIGHKHWYSDVLKVNRWSNNLRPLALSTPRGSGRGGPEKHLSTQNTTPQEIYHHDTNRQWRTIY